MAFWMVGIKAVRMACINDDSALLPFRLYSFVWYVNLRVTAFDVEEWGIMFCFCVSFFFALLLLEKNNKLIPICR